MSLSESMATLKGRWERTPGNEQLINELFSFFLNKRLLREAELFERELAKHFARAFGGQVPKSKWFYADELLECGYFLEALGVFSELKVDNEERACLGLATAHFNMGYSELACLELRSIYKPDSSEPVQLLFLKVLYYLADYRAAMEVIKNIRATGRSISGELKALIAMFLNDSEVILMEIRT